MDNTLKTIKAKSFIFSMKIYLDTCVYIDYLEDRKDNIRPLGELVHQLIKRAISCEFDIVTSDWVLDEIERYRSKEVFIELLHKLKKMNKITFVYKNKELEEEAKNLTTHQQIHYSDALHVVLAKAADAVYIVTRNVKDFPADYNGLKTVLPEDI